MAKALRPNDVVFFFGAARGGTYSHEAHRHTCSLCGRRFFDHGMPLYLEGASFKTLHFYFHVCGECLGSEPKAVAQKARGYASVLCTKRPERGIDDKDFNVKWADELLLVADLFDRIPSIDAIPDGVMARHIGEAYRELDGKAVA